MLLVVRDEGQELVLVTGLGAEEGLVEVDHGLEVFRVGAEDDVREADWGDDFGGRLVEVDVFGHDG